MLACSSAEDGSNEEPTSTSAAIINGQIDTEHDAVVSIYSEQDKTSMLCSATVIRIDAQSQIGYALTAGHCTQLTPKYVYLGDDLRSQATLRFEVIDSRKHPAYDGGVTSSYDFAIVRFAGADESIPVMPLLTPERDELAADALVTCFGFGRTAIPPAVSPNTARQSIDRSLSEVNATKLTYSIASGGICNGDSGGPAVVTLQGTEYVAGVHSYVTGNCDGNGVSGRVSAVHDWIGSVLAEPAPAESCDLCEKRASSGRGVCRGLGKACACHAVCADVCKGTVDCTDKEGPWTATAGEKVSTERGASGVYAAGGCTVMPTSGDARMASLVMAAAAAAMLRRRHRRR